jgi:hypothetical protein
MEPAFLAGKVWRGLSMRVLIIGFVMFLSTLASAKEAGVVAGDQLGYTHVLGRLNVNTATRAQLELVPGLDSSKIDAMLAAREKAQIVDLAGFSMTEEVELHLKTDGDSNLVRIRQNPLRRVDPTPASAAR